MAKNRYTPFGYMMRDGKIMINPVEAEAVRLIFEQYNVGDSYLTIAGILSDRGPNYHSDTSVWNKQMIKRILENRKYIGEKKYPGIITYRDFFTAQSIREGKTDGWERQSSCVKLVKSKAICHDCGAPFQKDTSNGRNSPYRWWHCSDEKCSCTLKTTDTELENAVTTMLNRVISDPSLLRFPSPQSPPISLEANKLNNEINRELSKPDFNEEYTISLIMACAAEMYECAANNTEYHEIDRMRAELEARAALEFFDADLFERVTDALLISSNGNIALRLKGGYIISEKEKEAV